MILYNGKQRKNKFLLNSIIFAKNYLTYIIPKRSKQKRKYLAMSMRNQSLDFVILVSFLVCMPRRMKFERAILIRPLIA